MTAKLSSFPPNTLLSIGTSASVALFIPYVSYPYTTHFFVKSVATQGPTPVLSLSPPLPHYHHLFTCVLVSAVSVSEPLKSVQKIKRFFKGRESHAIQHTKVTY